MTSEEKYGGCDGLNNKSETLTLHVALDQIVAAIDKVLDDPAPIRPEFPIEIVPWLFLSSQYACTRFERMEEMGITDVLTMNALPSNEASCRLEWSFREVGIDNFYLPAYDVEGYKLIDYHWEGCRKILQDVREKKGKAIVHCQMGQNRSALVVGAALVELEHWPILKTVRYLREKRGAVLTNRSFRRQLCELALRLGRIDEELAPKATSSP